MFLRRGAGDPDAGTPDAAGAAPPDVLPGLPPVLSTEPASDLGIRAEVYIGGKGDLGEAPGTRGVAEGADGGRQWESPPWPFDPPWPTRWRSQAPPNFSKGGSGRSVAGGARRRAGVPGPAPPSPPFPRRPTTSGPGDTCRAICRGGGVAPGGPPVPAVPPRGPPAGEARTHPAPPANPPFAPQRDFGVANSSKCFEGGPGTLSRRVARSPPDRSPGGAPPFSPPDPRMPAACRPAALQLQEGVLQGVQRSRPGCRPAGGPAFWIFAISVRGGQGRSSGKSGPAATAAPASLPRPPRSPTRQRRGDTCRTIYREGGREEVEKEKRCEIQQSCSGRFSRRVPSQKAARREIDWGRRFGNGKLADARL